MLPIVITLSSIIALVAAGWALISVSQKAMLIYTAFNVALTTLGLLIKLVIKGEITAVESVKGLNVLLKNQASALKGPTVDDKQTSGQQVADKPKAP